jgi:hypothetical protein
MPTKTLPNPETTQNPDLLQADLEELTKNGINLNSLPVIDYGIITSALGPTPEDQDYLDNAVVGKPPELES